jgi:putative exporter of polyketide antibiotics
MGLASVWRWVGAILAGMLVLFALGFVVSEIVRFRRRKTPGYTGFISVRSTLRRIVGSLFLIALGLMFYMGLCVLDLSHRPVLFGIYWIVCSILAFVLFLLGLLDLREVREHGSAHELRLLWSMKRGMPRK